MNEIWLLFGVPAFVISTASTGIALVWAIANPNKDEKPDLRFALGAWYLSAISGCAVFIGIYS